jgi:hypothetical protein
LPFRRVATMELQHRIKKASYRWATVVVTLKAFANSSPGLRFGNPGNTG